MKGSIKLQIARADRLPWQLAVARRAAKNVMRQERGDCDLSAVDPLFDRFESILDWRLCTRFVLAVAGINLDPIAHFAEIGNFNGGPVGQFRRFHDLTTGVASG